MLEAFNELMADPTSRAELVGGLVEVLIFIIPAGAYALSFRIRASLRRRHGGPEGVPPTSGLFPCKPAESKEPHYE